VSRLSKPKGAPILCYVTDRHALPKDQERDASATLLGKIQEAAAAGVDWIQIREKDLSGKECAALTGRAIECARRPPAGKTSGTRILVNDRLDVALLEPAGGVHLGENSLPPEEARKLVDSRIRRPDFLIGVSCHTLEAAAAAARGGADYIFFGPVFATPSKAAYGEPQGLRRLAEVCRAVSLPVVAIGGVRLDNAAFCFSAGASGIAAIRLFQDAKDVASVVKTVRALKV